MAGCPTQVGRLVFWCYNEHRGNFHIAPSALAPVIPANMRREFPHPAAFARWLFHRTHPANQPPAILVVGWHEAKECLRAVYAALTGDTTVMRPDAKRASVSRLPPSGGASAPAQINPVVGHVVVAVSDESMERAVQWARTMQSRLPGVIIEVVRRSGLVVHVQRTYSGTGGQSNQQQPSQQRHSQQSASSSSWHPGAAAWSSNHGQAASSSSWHPGAAASSSNHGQAASSSSSHAGAAATSSNHGQAASSSSWHPGAVASSSNHGQAASSSSSHQGAAASSSNQGAAASSFSQGASASSSAHAPAASSTNQAADAGNDVQAEATDSSGSTELDIDSMLSWGNPNLDDWDFLEDFMPTQD